DHSLDGPTETRIGAGQGRQLRSPLELPELRLPRDVAQRAGQRAGTEQRTLWSAQHLETLQIEQLQIRREQCNRDRRLVEVDADLLLHARLIANNLSGADATDRDLALS